MTQTIEYDYYFPLNRLVIEKIVSHTLDVMQLPYTLTHSTHPDQKDDAGVPLQRITVTVTRSALS